MTDLFQLEDGPRLPIRGSEQTFPVRRIYCVGRNYAEHTREMGGNPEREAPFFFCKHSSALVPDGAHIDYPTCTENLHHEIELVLALSAGGSHLDEEQAAACIYAYGVGNDLTRRDLQGEAKSMGRPWETSKDFDDSAPVSELVPAAECGQLKQGSIRLSVNGELRQQGDLSDMIWNPVEIVAELSRFFTLFPGDLVFTGTPAGVAAVGPGDVMVGTIESVGQLTTTISGDGGAH